MEIRDHALVYALLSKKLSDTLAQEKAEEVIRRITVSYGHKRGARMRTKALENQEEADLNAYMIHGEWTGKPGENESRTQYRSDSTVSAVTKCAWYDTWKKYGLLPYGTYYCRYIDQALCEGFAGNFSLEIPSSLSRGNSSCVFIWNAKADAEKIAEGKQKADGAYILPFDFHVQELLACAEEVLAQYGLENLIPAVLEEYEKLA